MKKFLLKTFGYMALIGSVAAGGYYYFTRRMKKPTVELYFDDGSMVVLQSSMKEAEGFLRTADEVLALSPLV